MKIELKFRLHDKEGVVIGYELHSKNEHGCYQILQQSLRDDFDELKNVREGYFIAATHKVQFTGLHDKNGKEIYEGDILSYKEDKPMVVQFGEFSIGIDSWGISCSAIGWHVVFHDGGKYPVFQKEDTDRYDIDTDQSEVIGNIYENPELLTNQPL